MDCYNYCFCIASSNSYFQLLCWQQVVLYKICKCSSLGHCCNSMLFLGSKDSLSLIARIVTCLELCFYCNYVTCHSYLIFCKSRLFLFWKMKTSIKIQMVKCNSWYPFVVNISFDQVSCSYLSPFLVLQCFTIWENSGNYFWCVPNIGYCFI